MVLFNLRHRDPIWKMGWTAWRLKSRESLRSVEGVRIQEAQAIGEDLAIKWEDGRETFIRLERLRRHCPCAGCRGETDVLGAVHRMPQSDFGPGAFDLKELHLVGGYALQPVWRDGHSTGIFSFEFLLGLEESNPSSP